jgi:hypothetical protein
MHIATEVTSMFGSVICPQCRHVLFAIELPIASHVQASDSSQPDAPLLLRVAEAARLLDVSRSTMYELVGQAMCRWSDRASIGTAEC